MTRSPGQRSVRQKGEIGWREFVALPDLSITTLRAKIDTGARTSALHAVDLDLYQHTGVLWVGFHVPLPGVSRSTRSTARLIDERQIKNTGGVPERRYVVQTTLVLGQRRWHIEVSLADRERMEFDLILGRTAIRRHGLLVNPGRSYIFGPPSSFSTDDHIALGDKHEYAHRQAALPTK